MPWLGRTAMPRQLRRAPAGVDQRTTHGVSALRATRRFELPLWSETNTVSVTGSYAEVKVDEERPSADVATSKAPSGPATCTAPPVGTNTRSC
jgi:hypothetical protein